MGRAIYREQKIILGYDTVNVEMTDNKRDLH